MRKSPAFLVATALMVLSCRHTATAPSLFEAVAPQASGITFTNTLPQDSTFNIINYLYYYNGAGVAAGDIDGDGLVDLYFTSNLGRNRLYRNLGNFHFEDITDRAGVADSVGWKSGVTMADVNGDGRLDIYVSGVNALGLQGRNVLYINNGDGTFTDRTAEYGLAFSGYSTQAAFFDYDGDGDLDMYLLNSSTLQERFNSPSTSRTVRNAKAGDRLYRNDAGHFVDVSAAAGIYGGVEGFGLGVVISDVNLDGCPDIYIANDFPENDFLYLNNCNGTFTESIVQATGHTSRFSMGVDAADVNNDGRPDIAVLDMLPDSERILKSAATGESYELLNLKLAAGYHYQYTRNTLQLNRGVTGGALRFSEIGFLAGIAATDWSWAPLFADFDNDGRKDLFVTAGIYRRPNDLDYLASLVSAGPGGPGRPGGGPAPAPDIAKMPHVPVPNYAFRNNGDLTFTNQAAAWGLGAPGFANGAAYVDLDNDGALDLVVNNLNAPATIYRNRARELDSAAHHFLTVTLRGEGGNTGGIGAKVIIAGSTGRQMVEVMPTRGFESAVDPRAHFGLGTASSVDSLIVVWPDRRFQVLTHVPANQFITLSQKDATGRYSYAPPAAKPLFTDVSPQVTSPYRHHENTFFDYGREPLMPHLLSTEGPALAIADVTGDGRDDIYAGGAKWQPGELLVQGPDGAFRAAVEPAFRADSLHEDVDAAFFDADGDGDLDLYVVSGGNEFWEGEPLRDRLYLNDGHGNFQRANDALPVFYHNGSCVVPGDFDGDGDVDLFVGSRVVTSHYGVMPRSYLLQNDGHGHFRDVTTELAPGLDSVGMVSRAVWIDYDGDGKLDLIVVGEWMPVRVFHQENGKFVDRTDNAGFAGTNGWWTSIQAVDVNGDGRPDLVLGNLGVNSFIRASRAEPARLYIGDFLDTGRLAQILTSYRHGKSYPLAGRDELIQVMPALASRYPTYASFGASGIEDIIPAKALRKARVLEADTFASAVALNHGDGTFELRPLPLEAQFAPIYSSLAGDFDGDGKTDLIVAGNFYGVTPVQGRYDASYGLLLHGDGRGNFSPVDMERSGLVIEGQVRHMAFMKRANGERSIVVARNNERLQVISAP
ncbi:MAG TPA: VCBS repeat-containing protein [Gemmatimonadales bacterium]|nr:VCBS repeat-containing protein [Gemmatimonadales bacterium]